MNVNDRVVICHPTMQDMIDRFMKDRGGYKSPHGRIVEIHDTPHGKRECVVEWDSGTKSTIYENFLKLEDNNAISTS